MPCRPGWLACGGILHAPSQPRSSSQGPYPAFNGPPQIPPTFKPPVWGTFCTTPPFSPCSCCFSLFPPLGNKHTSALSITMPWHSHSCAVRGAWLQEPLQLLLPSCANSAFYHTSGRLLGSRTIGVMKSIGFKAI